MESIEPSSTCPSASPDPATFSPNTRRLKQQKDALCHLVEQQQHERMIVIASVENFKRTEAELRKCFAERERIAEDFFREEKMLNAELSAFLHLKNTIAEELEEVFPSSYGERSTSPGGRRMKGFLFSSSSFNGGKNDDLQPSGDIYCSNTVAAAGSSDVSRLSTKQQRQQEKAQMLQFVGDPKQNKLELQRQCKLGPHKNVKKSEQKVTAKAQASETDLFAFDCGEMLLQCGREAQQARRWAGIMRENSGLVLDTIAFATKDMEKKKLDKKLKLREGFEADVKVPLKQKIECERRVLLEELEYLSAVLKEYSTISS